jgi:hypothetical protein
MRAILRIDVCAVILLIAAAARAQETPTNAPIAPDGQRLAQTLDQMDVEHHWLAGKSVRWRTGEPSDRPVTDAKGHTHCSAFVAAAAAELGIYILRPPQHSAALLANAQYDWLGGEGRKEGWTSVPTGQDAQKLANQGQLVVAVYKSSDPKKPGHIAIVRPCTKSEAKIREEGPQIIQAGKHNYASATLAEGFKQHKGAFRDGRIRFFAHPLPAKPKDPAAASGSGVTSAPSSPARPSDRRD